MSKINIKDLENISNKYFTITSDQVKAFCKLARAADTVERMEPTPDNYVGGQCISSQMRHVERKHLKIALEAFDFLGDE